MQNYMKISLVYNKEHLNKREGEIIRAIGNLHKKQKVEHILNHKKNIMNKIKIKLFKKKIQRTI